jgi:hypothetical protein
MTTQVQEGRPTIARTHLSFGNCSVLSSVSEAAEKLKAYRERIPASSELSQERGERVHGQVAGVGGGLRQGSDFAN